ncbi:MAG: hypothetical protein OFPI_20590 [Osedax symbiont Rs2]|nr:MAG: hypothetical protein OFPI_20590 [Osedax symbiont Rs2]
MTDNQKYTVVQICQTRKARIIAMRKKRDVSQLQQEDMFSSIDLQIDLF